MSATDSTAAVHCLPVAGFYAYFIDEMGVVYSTYKWDCHGNVYVGSDKRPLATDSMDSGHLRVSLTQSGKTTKRLVHQLVLETFVGPCPPGCESRHLNDDPADNRLENLRWGTRKENSDDRARNNEGVYHVGRTCRTTAAERHRMRKLRAMGMTIRQISLRTDWHRKTVARHV